MSFWAEGTIAEVKIPRQTFSILKVYDLLCSFGLITKHLVFDIIFRCATILKKKKTTKQFWKKIVRMLKDIVTESCVMNEYKIGDKC